MPGRMKAVLIGAGGHARVVLDAARAANGIEVSCVVDADPAKRGTAFEGLEVVGDESALAGIRARGVEAIVLGVGSIDVGRGRRALFERVSVLGFELPAVIHPAAVISPSAQIGAACVVFAGAILNPGVRLGDNVIVNTAAVLDHDVVIGDHAHVSPGAHLAGGVTVGEGSHVGIGATVLQGVRIGANVVVGAGAVVVRDVPDGDRVAGVPARSLRQVEKA
jgi:sugar O-acyltransferase (sialic acid O-acetyltransferase NeuD family)